MIISIIFMTGMFHLVVILESENKCSHSQGLWLTTLSSSHQIKFVALPFPPVRRGTLPKKQKITSVSIQNTLQTTY